MPYWSISFTIGQRIRMAPAGSLADGYDVLMDLVVYVHLTRELSDADHGVRIGDGSNLQLFQPGVQHLHFVRGGRVIDADHHGEAIQLRLRQ